MSSLTSAQRELNIAQVKSMINKIYRMSGGSFLQLLNSERIPLEGLQIQQGGRAALLPEL